MQLPPDISARLFDDGFVDQTRFAQTLIQIKDNAIIVLNRRDTTGYGQCSKPRTRLDKPVHRNTQVHALALDVRCTGCVSHAVVSERPAQPPVQASRTGWAVYAASW